MSDDIKVGDVCEIVFRPFSRITSRFAGTQCTVLRVATDVRLFGAMHEFELFDGSVAKIAAVFLRKIPPKARERAEPRADFTPGEWDLCPWTPNKTKEHA